jgi:hypothetical protein
MYPEMMRWLSRLLNGVVVDFGWDFGSEVGAKNEIFDQCHQQKNKPSTTNMAQMILSKPLCIIVWMYTQR